MKTLILNNGQVNSLRDALNNYLAEVEETKDDGDDAEKEFIEQITIPNLEDVLEQLRRE